MAQKDGQGGNSHGGNEEPWRRPAEEPPRIVADSADLAGAHPHIQALHDYYLKLREARGALPRAKSVDPIEIPALLPFLVIITLHEDGTLRPRYRLTGTSIDMMVGRNLSGAYLDTVHTPAEMERILALHREIIGDRQSRFMRSRLILESRQYITAERLIVPLAEDGETVDSVAGIVVRLPG